MATKTGIINMALGFIGEPTITHPDEHSPQAITVDTYYDEALLQLLREHPWNFARDRAALNPVPLPDVWSREYSFAYAYPAKCVRVHFLLTPDNVQSRRFLAGLHEGERTLYANIPQAAAEITRHVTDTTAYDPKFTLALARSLARFIVKPMLKNNGNGNLIQELERLYALALDDARTADMREGRPFEDAGGYWDERVEYWYKDAKDGAY
jgi:hypothetical protein